MPDTIDKLETRERPGTVISFLGGSPGRVAVRLIIVSLLVGFLMSIFGISPQDVLLSVERFINDVFNNGFGVLRELSGYVIAGAAIVVPIWLISRLFAAGRRR